MELNDIRNTRALMDVHANYIYGVTLVSTLTPAYAVLDPEGREKEGEERSRKEEMEKKKERGRPASKVETRLMRRILQ